VNKLFLALTLIVAITAQGIFADTQKCPCNKPKPPAAVVLPGHRTFEVKCPCNAHKPKPQQKRCAACHHKPRPTTPAR